MYNLLRRICSSNGKRSETRLMCKTCFVSCMQINITKIRFIKIHKRDYYEKMIK